MVLSTRAKNQICPRWSYCNTSFQQIIFSLFPSSLTISQQIPDHMVNLVQKAKNYTPQSIQGPPYMLGQAIMPRTWYSLMILNRSSTVDSDERYINMLHYHLKRFLEKCLYYVILLSLKIFIYPLCAVHKSVTFLPIEDVIVKILMSFFRFLKH